ncbi:hypothetical protein ACHAXT_003241 [Thalassiosira profunda]
MPELAPVCAFWHKRLLEVSARSVSSSGQEEVGNASLRAARAVICCYESTIHPCLKRQRGPSVGVDINDGGDGEKRLPLHTMVKICKVYELLLATLLRDSAATPSPDGTVEKRECGQSTDSDKMSETCAVVECRGEEISNDNVCRTVHIIANDIFQWSAGLPKNTEELCRNVLLPCLLRLIEHAVLLLAPFKCSNGNAKCNKQQIQRALAIATLTAVPFAGDGKLKSGAFGIGTLLEWIYRRRDNKDCDDEEAYPLLLAHTIQSCSLYPVANGEGVVGAHTINAPIAKSNFMTRPVVDWSVKSAQFAAPWTDGVTGTGSRVALSLLQTIHRSLCGDQHSKEEQLDNPPSLRQLLGQLCQRIGVELLSSTVRAHFYGRLSASTSDAIVDPKASCPFMPMIQRIGSDAIRPTAVTASSSDEKTHIDIPMRASAAAIVFCAALDQPDSNFDQLDSAFSDALPVALTLLDDVQSIHQAIGALILVSVIESASKLEVAIPAFVEKFGSVVTSSLETGVQMNSRGEPTVLAAICLAQSRWIRYLGSKSNNQRIAGLPEASTLARKAASDVLIAISKQAQIGARDGNDERIAGALVAGVNPLLAQLAELPEAASIEVARVGLAPLLPSIGWSGTSLETRSVQIAATSGLISLMNGAYPVMPHHGKKIMTEVFLLLDRLDKDAEFLRNNAKDGNRGTEDDTVSTDVAAKVALHAAAVALAICGSGAEDVLQHVEATQTRKRVLERCSEIRTMSETLLSRNAKH